MALAQSPARPRDLKATTPDASKILQRIVYGWFMRVERGVYALTDGGRERHLSDGKRISPKPHRPPNPNFIASATWHPLRMMRDDWTSAYERTGRRCARARWWPLLTQRPL